jgi:hypothetical protein
MKPLRQLSGRLGEVLATVTAGARQAARDFFQELRRVDKQLEIAFYRLIALVMILLIPVWLVIGAIVGTIWVLCLCAKAIWQHKPPCRTDGGRSDG